MQSSYRSFPRGMQVHAVPEADRHIDASGRRLPWGYDASAPVENREPVEKGPFGRSQRRSRSGLTRSRSRTAEPRREEDRIRVEQLAAEDAVFGSLRKATKDDSRREALGEVDANAVAQPATANHTGEQEATEVLLYGFGEELQWAALDHYERVSGGSILEDYDRQPPGPRYDASRSLSRATGRRSLSRAALKKKNTFAGGAHWIKITFDSRGAAELACARSPHIIKGHLVLAEPYHGRGPGKDEAILASQAGAQITDSILPATFSTHTPALGSPNGSSTTATSATATARRESAQQNGGSQASSPTPTGPIASRASHPSLPRPQSLGISSGRQSSSTRTPRRRPPIDGVKAAVLLPPSAALLPKQPKQSWSTWLGTSEVIGSTVPKKDDGSFDYNKASLYWKVFWWLDSAIGTDFCGMKGD